jgi:hypothetical protein
MIDNMVLRERIRAGLDHLRLVGAKADQVVEEINVLACLLIDAVLQEIPHGEAN